MSAVETVCAECAAEFRISPCPHKKAAASDSVRRNLAVLDAAIDVSDEVRMLKIAEEYGEATEAFFGSRGANPRKGVTDHTDVDVATELADVALTALVAMFRFTPDPVQALTNRLAFVAGRIEVST